MNTPVSNLGIETDLEIQQGADFEAHLTVIADPTTTPPTPTNLGACVFTAQLRKRPLSADPIATFDVDIVDENAGTITVSLSSRVTAALVATESESDPESQYVWDLRLQDAGNNISVPFYGSVSVRASVTRL